MRKKSITIAVAVALAAILQFALGSSVSAAAPVYKDYSELEPVISEDGASTRLYFTEDTRFTIKQMANDEDAETSVTMDKMYIVRPGREMIVLIENTTARDKDGNPIDVIFRLNNAHSYTDVIMNGEPTTVANYFGVQFSSTTCGYDGVSEMIEQASCRYTTLGPGDPIVFWLDANYSYGDLTVEYIKKGSYNNSTKRGTPAGITKITYMTYDYDVPLPGGVSTNSALFGGNEGIATLDGPSQVVNYYNKNVSATDTHFIERDNGLAVTSMGANHSGSFNGIYWGGSCFSVASNLQNSSHTVRYSATTAGVAMIIGSPVAVDTPAPKKFVEEDKVENHVNVGVDFDYSIEQVVPELYSSENDVLAFASLYGKYPNMKTNHNYTRFEIGDTLNESLVLPDASRVKVYREGVDVTNEFDITISGQNLLVKAKNTALLSNDFYGGNLKIVLPVKVRENFTDAIFTNAATTTYQYTGITVRNKQSNPVTTYVYHKLTTRYIDKDTGKPIADPVEADYPHNYEYTTKPLATIPEGYTLVETPSNASGTLDGNTVVTYYYKGPDNPSTLDQDYSPLAFVFGGAIAGAGAIFFAVSKRR